MHSYLPYNTISYTVISMTSRIIC